MSPKPRENTDAPGLTVCYFWVGADFAALDPERIAGLLALHDRRRFKPIAALDTAAIERIGLDTLRRTFERVLRVDQESVRPIIAELERKGVEFLIDLQGGLRRTYPDAFPTIREPITVDWFAPDVPPTGPRPVYRICGVDALRTEGPPAPFPVMLSAAPDGDPAQGVRALEHALRRVWRNHLAVRHAPVIPLSAAFELAAVRGAKPAPMRIAVVTPYHRESLEDLRTCHESVLAQTLACTHYMVADGFPLPAIDGWNVRHVKLPVAHGSGNTATGIGALLAASEGFDAIAFLDGDNWYHPDHLQTMVELHESTLADICAARRDLHRLDGSFLIEDRTPDDVELIDTSCYFVASTAFSTLHHWTRMISTMADRVYLRILRKKGYAIARASHPTVAYRTGWLPHYRAAGEPAPEGWQVRKRRIHAARRTWAALSARQWDAWMNDACPAGVRRATPEGD